FATFEGLVRPQRDTEVGAALNLLLLPLSVLLGLQRGRLVPYLNVLPILGRSHLEILRVRLLSKQNHLFSDRRDVLVSVLLFLITERKPVGETPDALGEGVRQRFVAGKYKMRNEPSDIGLAVRLAIQGADRAQLRTVLIPVAHLVCRCRILNDARDVPSPEVRTGHKRKSVGKRRAWVSQAEADAARSAGEDLNERHPPSRQTL